MSFGGVTILKSGDRVIPDALVLDDSGGAVASGSMTVMLLELQSAYTGSSPTGSRFKTFDFNDNTFKSTTCTTPTASMNHNTANNGAANTGLWTAGITTLTGFTRGNTYYAIYTHSVYGAQVSKFVYGGADGDALPNVLPGATGGLPLIGTGTNQFKSDANARVDLGAVQGSTANANTLAAQLAWSANHGGFASTDLEGNDVAAADALAAISPLIIEWTTTVIVPLSGGETTISIVDPGVGVPAELIGKTLRVTGTGFTQDFEIVTQEGIDGTINLGVDQAVLGAVNNGAQAQVLYTQDLAAATASAVKASLIGLFRLLARNDAAARSDNAQDLLLINNDGGSGAGDFDPTARSLEAIPDTIKTALLGLFRLLARNDVGSRNDNIVDLALINADLGRGAGDYDPLTQSLEAQQLADAAARTGLSGSGVTINWEDSSHAETPGVQFAVVGEGLGAADGSARASFGLRDGTYTVRTFPKNGVLFADYTLTVSGTTTATITGTTSPTIVTPSTDPATTNAYLTTFDQNFAPEAGVIIQIRLLSTDGESGRSFPREPESYTSDSEGLVQATLGRLATYQGRRGTRGEWSAAFTTTDTSTYALPEILGRTSE